MTAISHTRVSAVYALPPFGHRIALEGAANGDLRGDVNGIKLVKRQLMRPVLFWLNGKFANLRYLVRNEFQNASLRKVYRTWPIFVLLARCSKQKCPVRRMQWRSMRARRSPSRIDFCKYI